jgi:hypothetical protein
MKCSLCGKEIEEGEPHVIRINVIYHAVVQDCQKRREKKDATN